MPNAADVIWARQWSEWIEKAVRRHQLPGGLLLHDVRKDPVGKTRFGIVISVIGITHQSSYLSSN
jgi:hypothetical protein